MSAPPRSRAHAKIAVGGKQHVQLHRKILLRRHLIRHAVEGAAYVPFIGDGDIASIIYPDRFVMGADLDPQRVATASSRLRGDIRVFDCDLWPFAGKKIPFAVADFDAYADPYTSFRAFWENAEKEDRLVLYFTDGLPQGIIRSGVWTKFDGTKEDDLPPLPDRRRSELYNAYLGRYVWPMFEDYIKPYKVIDRFRYRRHHVIYWGVAIERQIERV